MFFQGQLSLNAGLTDSLYMTIAVELDFKPQTKQTIKKHLDVCNTFHEIILTFTRGMEIVKFSTCPGTSKWP